MIRADEEGVDSVQLPLAAKVGLKSLRAPDAGCGCSHGMAADRIKNRYSVPGARDARVVLAAFAQCSMSSQVGGLIK